MKIRKKINKDFLKAFKEKNKVAKNLLSVVKSEIQTTEKNLGSELSDSESIKILNKMAKSLKESISNSDDKDLKVELNIIKDYLPKQMSEDEIKEKINSLSENGAKNMGDFMKAFSNLQVDRKLVNKLVREKLN